MAIHQNHLMMPYQVMLKLSGDLTPKQIKQAQQKDRFCKEQNAKIVKGSLASTTHLITYRVVYS